MLRARAGSSLASSEAGRRRLVWRVIAMLLSSSGVAAEAVSDRAPADSGRDRAHEPGVERDALAAGGRLGLGLQPLREPERHPGRGVVVAGRRRRLVADERQLDVARRSGGRRSARSASWAVSSIAASCEGVEEVHAHRGLDGAREPVRRLDDRLIPQRGGRGQVGPQPIDES